MDDRTGSPTLVWNRVNRPKTVQEPPREMFPGNRRILYLSKRETEILQQVAHGATNLEIAAKLGISQQTVKNHMSSIFSKLRVRRRGAAAAQAIKQGLVKAR